MAVLHRLGRSTGTVARRHGQILGARAWPAALSASLQCSLVNVRSLVTAESPKAMKRFYEEVSVKELEGQGWQVMLDHRIVKTPKMSLLALPSRAAAEGVAAEWRSQKEFVKPKEMPLMTFACTAVDLVRPGVEACVDRMLPYVETDTVCFEDDHEPLADLQSKEWGPLRKWYEEKHGVTLRVARGLEVPNHPQETMYKIRSDLCQRNEWELVALEVATNTAKSLIVATALVDREDVDGEYAHRWAMLEEFFQIDRWGLVEGEHDVAHMDALVWLNGATRFVELCRDTN